MTHVDWHPYPEEKPNFYELVLVTLLCPDGERVVDVDTIHNRPNSIEKEQWGFDISDKKVIAWAELPEPYVPTIKKKEPPPVVHIDYFGDHPDDIWGWKKRLKEETK